MTGNEGARVHFETHLVGEIRELRLALKDNAIGKVMQAELLD
jgi:hypothetical protein